MGEIYTPAVWDMSIYFPIFVLIKKVVYLSKIDHREAIINGRISEIS
jgi:hypothetical protein